MGQIGICEQREMEMEIERSGEGGGRRKMVRKKRHAENESERRLKDRGMKKLRSGVHILCYNI